MTDEIETPIIDAAMLSRNEGVHEVFDAHEPYIAWTDYWALGEEAKKIERELTLVTQERDALRATVSPPQAELSEREKKLVAAVKIHKLSVQMYDEIESLPDLQGWLDAAGKVDEAEKEMYRCLAAYEPGGEEEGNE